MADWATSLGNQRTRGGAGGRKCWLFTSSVTDGGGEGRSSGRRGSARGGRGRGAPALGREREKPASYAPPDRPQETYGYDINVRWEGTGGGGGGPFGGPRTRRSGRRRGSRATPRTTSTSTGNPGGRAGDDDDDDGGGAPTTAMNTPSPAAPGARSWQTRERDRERHVRLRDANGSGAGPVRPGGGRIFPCSPHAVDAPPAPATAASVSPQRGAGPVTATPLPAQGAAKAPTARAPQAFGRNRARDAGAVGACGSAAAATATATAPSPSGPATPGSSPCGPSAAQTAATASARLPRSTGGGGGAAGSARTELPLPEDTPAPAPTPSHPPVRLVRGGVGSVGRGRNAPHAQSAAAATYHTAGAGSGGIHHGKNNPQHARGSMACASPASTRAGAGAARGGGHQNQSTAGGTGCAGGGNGSGSTWYERLAAHAAGGDAERYRRFARGGTVAAPGRAATTQPRAYDDAPDPDPDAVSPVACTLAPYYYEGEPSSTAGGRVPPRAAFGSPLKASSSSAPSSPLGADGLGVAAAATESPTAPGAVTVEWLPYDAVLRVFSYLRYSDLGVCCRITRTWAVWACDDVLWAGACADPLLTSALRYLSDHDVPAHTGCKERYRHLVQHYAIACGRPFRPWYLRRGGGADAAAKPKRQVLPRRDREGIRRVGTLETTSKRIEEAAQCVTKYREEHAKLERKVAATQRELAEQDALATEILEQPFPSFAGDD